MPLLRSAFYATVITGAAALVLMAPTGQEPDVVVVASGDYDHPTTTHGYPTTTHGTYPTTTHAETTTTPAPPPPTLTTLPATTTTVMAPPTSVEQKVTICHLPPGNPANFQIIEIGFPALAAHLAHGDIYPVPAGGICFVAPTTSSIPTSQFSIPPGTTTTLPPGVTTTASPSSSTTTSTVPSSTSSTVGASTTTPLTTQPIGPTPGPGAPFTFGAAATVCDAEVPTIRIEFQNTFPELAGRTGVLTMADVNGNVVSTQELVYQPGVTVDLLYPGTAVNPDGTIADVPGWNLNAAGFWVRDPSDEFLREGINLTYTVNPTATAFVTYPPETAACANPNGPFGPGNALDTLNSPRDTLPPAGGPWVPILIGVGLGAIGVGFGIKRRTA